jgi:hypothetical protein
MPGLLEQPVRSPREEAMAREGMCPGCLEPAFIGHGKRVMVDLPPRGREMTEAELNAPIKPRFEEVGTCLCRHCMVVWQYALAARRRWN